jgi:hypothetical protein
MSQQVWHDKDPSLLLKKALNAKHRPKFSSRFTGNDDVSI